MTLRVYEDTTMTTLTVTARGQVTFRKDVLQHLGVKPGEQIDFDKLPGGELRIRGARPMGGAFKQTSQKLHRLYNRSLW